MMWLGLPICAYSPQIHGPSHRHTQVLGNASPGRDCELAISHASRNWETRNRRKSHLGSMFRPSAQDGNTHNAEHKTLNLDAKHPTVAS